MKNNFFQDEEEKLEKYKKTLTPEEIDEIDEVCSIISEAYMETYGYEFGELPVTVVTKMPSGERIIGVYPKHFHDFL